jgi:hypothetical protein
MRKPPSLARKRPVPMFGAKGAPELDLPSGPLPERFRILLSLLDGAERRHTLSRRWRGQEPGPVFQRYAQAFSPLELDMMTSAFYAAVRELERAGREVPQSELERRIAARARQGVFEVAELKWAALGEAGKPLRR